MLYPRLLQPYSLAIKFPVGIPQPAQGWLVLTGQAMVQVHQRVITLHVLVQCEFQIPEKRQLLNSLHALPRRGSSSLWDSFLHAITGFASLAMEVCTLGGHVQLKKLLQTDLAPGIQHLGITSGLRS